MRHRNDSPASAPRNASLAATILALILTLLSTQLAEANVFSGSAKADHLVGTNHADRIVAKGGADRVSARGGDDYISAGGGKDLVLGGRGADRLKGGGGADEIHGGGGNDVFKARGGGDQLETTDGKGDGLIDAGGGVDSCVVDDEDVALVQFCETVQIIEAGQGGGGGAGGGGGGTGGGGAGGGGATSDLAFVEATAMCQGNAEFGNGCTFTVSGTGADAPAGSAEVTSGGSGGGVVGADPTTGEWQAAGGYGCTEPVTLTVTIGDESVEVPLPCGGAPDAPLAVTSSTGLADCSAPVPSCAFTISGTGADAPTGTVTPNGGIVGAGGVQADGDGNWTATGQYGCTADGGLTVTIGDESVTLPIACAAAGGGGGENNGPLVANAPTVSCQSDPSGFGNGCQFTVTGTGADVPTGSAVVTHSTPLGSAVTGGGAVSSDPTGAGGSWEATGGFGCTDPATLTVMIGTESVLVTLPCG